MAQSQELRFHFLFAAALGPMKHYGARRVDQSHDQPLHQILQIAYISQLMQSVPGLQNVYVMRREHLNELKIYFICFLMEFKTTSGTNFCC
jgi:hypothetical protein